MRHTLARTLHTLTKHQYSQERHSCERVSMYFFTLRVYVIRPVTKNAFGDPFSRSHCRLWHVLLRRLLWPWCPSLWFLLTRELLPCVQSTILGRLMVPLSLFVYTTRSCAAHRICDTFSFCRSLRRDSYANRARIHSTLNARTFCRRCATSSDLNFEQLISRCSLPGAYVGSRHSDFFTSLFFFPPSKLLVAWTIVVNRGTAMTLLLMEGVGSLRQLVNTFCMSRYEFQQRIHRRMNSTWTFHAYVKLPISWTSQRWIFQNEICTKTVPFLDLFAVELFLVYLG